MRNNSGNNGRESYLVAGDQLVYDSELVKERKKNADLEKKVKQQQAELKNLKAEKKATERQESDAVCQSRALQQQVQQWKNRCINAYETSQKEQLKSQEFQDSYFTEKKKFDDRREDFQSNLNGLTSKLAAVRQEFEAGQGQLAAQLTGVKAENRKLAGQLASAQAELKTAQAGRTQHAVAYKSTTSQLAAAQAELKTAQADRSQSEAAHKCTTSQLAAAQAELKTAQADRSQSEAAHKCTTSQLAAVQRELKTARAYRRQHEAVHKRTTSQLETVQRELKTAQRELKTAQAVHRPAHATTNSVFCGVHNGKINQPSTEEAGCQWWNEVDDVVTKAECRNIARGRQFEMEDAGAHEQAKQAPQCRVYPSGIWRDPPSGSPVSSPGSSGSPVDSPGSSGSSAGRPSFAFFPNGDSDGTPSWTPDQFLSKLNLAELRPLK